MCKSRNVKAIRFPIRGGISHDNSLPPNYMIFILAEWWSIEKGKHAMRGLLDNVIGVCYIG